MSEQYAYEEGYGDPAWYDIRSDETRKPVRPFTELSKEAQPSKAIPASSASELLQQLRQITEYVCRSRFNTLDAEDSVCRHVVLTPR